MPSEVIIWILFVLTFTFGYVLGRREIKIDKIAEVKKKFEKLGSIIRSERVGPVMRPTASKLEEIRNPYIQGAKEAMRADLEKIPELNT